MKKLNTIIIGMAISIIRGVGHFSYAQSLDSTVFQNNFASLQDVLGTAETRKQFVQNFCNEVLKIDSFQFKDQPSQLYNPGGSVFLYILCRNVGIDKSKFNKFFQVGNESSLTNDFVKNRSFPGKKDSNAKSDLDTFDGCSILGDMQQCNFSKILPQVFNTLINEYANIKQATLYGYKGDEVSVEEQIKQFSNDYFEDASISSCAGNNTFYLGKSQNTDTKTDQCSHPKTYNYLKQSIQTTKALVLPSNFQILNPQPLFILMKSPGNRTPESLAFEPGMGMEVFQNLVYNELMWYNLFMSSYRYGLLSTPKLQPSLFGSIDKIKESQQEEIDSLSQAIITSQRAVPLMIRMLKNIAYTFPIHIGMLAYYEDLIAFRDVLARIYTPIDQLYYKLRNVQDTK